MVVERERSEEAQLRRLAASRRAVLHGPGSGPGHVAESTEDTDNDNGPRDLVA